MKTTLEVRLGVRAECSEQPAAGTEAFRRAGKKGSMMRRIWNSLLSGPAMEAAVAAADSNGPSCPSGSFLHQHSPARYHFGACLIAVPHNLFILPDEAGVWGSQKPSTTLARVPRSSSRESGKLMQQPAILPHYSGVRPNSPPQTHSMVSARRNDGYSGGFPNHPRPGNLQSSVKKRAFCTVVYANHMEGKIQELPAGRVEVRGEISYAVAISTGQEGNLNG